MKLLALVAVALLLPQEKNEAEALFKKMEEKIAKSKTFQLKFSGELQPAKMAVTGHLLSDEGNRMRLDLEGKVEGQTHTATMISDGKKLRFKSSDKPEPKVLDVPETFGPLSRACISRGGFFGMLDSLDNEEGLKAKADDHFLPSAFKLGAKEKVGDREAQAVDYRLVKENHPETQVTIWIDTQTNLPLKRSLKMGDMSLTETYSDCKVDEKLDAAKFELPKDK